MFGREVRETMKNVYICLGKQQKYKDKPYYNIQSLLTGKFLVLQNDVGIEKNGIYAEDLKKLLIETNYIEILNLGLTKNNQFYEKSMSSNKCKFVMLADEELCGICFKVGMKVKHRDPNVVLKSGVDKRSKNISSTILSSHFLQINNYIIIIRNDCFGNYYVYDNKFLCCEHIKSKAETQRCVEQAIAEEFYNY